MFQFKARHNLQIYTKLPLHPYPRSISSSTTLKPAYQIFQDGPPLPPSFPPRTPTSSDLTSSTTSQWTIFSWRPSNTPTLGSKLREFQAALRRLHKRKIDWPEEEALPSNLSQPEYLAILLTPLLNIFNQLRPAFGPKAPVKLNPIDLGESIYGATFASDNFETYNVSTPILLSVSGDLFDSGNISSIAQHALCKLFDYEPGVATIIVTDFKDLAVFYFNPEPVYEKITTEQLPLALRATFAAYMHAAPPVGVYIHFPGPYCSNTVEIPIGPPQDPNQPLLPDAQIFATRHRHSDFDLPTLAHDQQRALQFSRWRTHMQGHHCKDVVHTNDVLTAVNNDSAFLLPSVHPIHPFNPSDLPIGTAAHLRATQRESPLVAAGISKSFEQNQLFTVQIQHAIAGSSKYSICTVYRCRIVSINGKIVSSPYLCLKLFDDRSQQLETPDKNDEQSEENRGGIVYAEDLVRYETSAYNKLRPVQGTIIPWFYGTHQFTLPDGSLVYGILLEYIEGWGLNSDFARGLSPDRQIRMIESCRHAVRVLDVADVNQRDWHENQIIFCRNPATETDHVVLIDFAATSQTWDRDHPHILENYVESLYTLLGLYGPAALDPELVWKHYGEPDDWDPVQRLVPKSPHADQSAGVVARDMFPYITVS